MVDPLDNGTQAGGSIELVEFSDAGVAIYYDSSNRQFFVDETSGFRHTGDPISRKRVLGSGDPLLREVFGKAQSGQLSPSLSPNTVAQINEDARQFDLAFGQRQDESAETARQANLTLQQTADLANQQAALRVAETNATLRANEAQFREQIRQTNIQDAQSQESMRFLILKEKTATAENNRSALADARAFIETVNSRLETNRFQRTQLETQIATTNAQIEQNVQMFNSQEKARTEQLNETRRQFNLEQLQSVSRDIGTLSQNPADVGKLAGFLRSGNPAPISAAISRGENAITDESLLGLRGLLGVREGLQQGPPLATPNLITADTVATPEFGELGVAPELGDVFSQIGFDPSGIARENSPVANDPSQFFQQIAAPGLSPAPVPGGTPAPAQSAAPPGVGGAAQDFFESSARTGTQVNPNGISSADIDKFFEGFARGGVAPPGSPVVVGDGQGDSRELAMTDAQGNLVVIPFDQLPHAATGGVFNRLTGEDTRSAEAIAADRRASEVFNSTFNRSPGGGVFNRLTGEDTRSAEAIAADRRSSEMFNTTFSSSPGGGARVGGISPTITAPGAGGQAQPQIGPVSPEVARAFLGDTQRDALRRGGFTDPSQVSPLKVSAPGTSKFLQDLSASVAGALGFGSPELFFEELAKLQPRGVQSGTARRTA